MYDSRPTVISTHRTKFAARRRVRHLNSSGYVAPGWYYFRRDGFRRWQVCVHYSSLGLGGRRGSHNP